MGCQKAIAKTIVDKQVDYILALKENQSELLEEVVDEFRFYKANEFFQELDYGYGRIETRKYSVINNFDLVQSHIKWKGMKSIIRIESTREFKNRNKKA